MGLLVSNLQFLALLTSRFSFINYTNGVESPQNVPNEGFSVPIFQLFLPYPSMSQLSDKPF